MHGHAHAVARTQKWLRTDLGTAILDFGADDDGQVEGDDCDSDGVRAWRPAVGSGRVNCNLGRAPDDPIRRVEGRCDAWVSPQDSANSPQSFQFPGRQLLLLTFDRDGGLHAFADGERT